MPFSSATLNSVTMRLTRSENAAAVVLPRMPLGFCPPLKCHSGIMANSTMHQMNAMMTQTRSCLLASVHHTPCGGTMAECISVVPLIGLAPSMGVGSGQVRGRQRHDLVEAPARVEDHHDDDPGGQEQEGDRKST